MKHQVFLFLSIFSFSVYAMDKKAVDNVTNVQLADALQAYCLVCSIKTENSKAFIEELRKTPLTFENKIAILEEMKNFPQPNVCIIGNRAILFERDSNGSKSTVC